MALIQGACIGGGLEIAGACDLRICNESARFGAPINRLGFSMYPGEMESLLKLAGAAVLKEILLEGRIWGAREAYETTLVAPSEPRRLRFPAWVRVTAVDPVTLEPRPTGETDGSS